MLGEGNWGNFLPSLMYGVPLGKASRVKVDVYSGNVSSLQNHLDLSWSPDFEGYSGTVLFAVKTFFWPETKQPKSLQTLKQIGYFSAVRELDELKETTAWSLCRGSWISRSVGSDPGCFQPRPTLSPSVQLSMCPRPWTRPVQQSWLLWSIYLILFIKWSFSFQPFGRSFRKGLEAVFREENLVHFSQLAELVITWQSWSLSVLGCTSMRLKPSWPSSMRYRRRPWTGRCLVRQSYSYVFSDLRIKWIRGSHRFPLQTTGVDTIRT